MSDKEIIEIYNKGINAVIALVKGMDDKLVVLGQELVDLNQEFVDLTKGFLNLEQENQKLNARIAILESQVNKNSNNSSKPPSSDGLKKKPKNSRKKAAKQRVVSPAMTERPLRRLEILIRLLI